jgi:aspartyl-tRNA(Asn)/glutamyl-tRNA(Gln) amidotransferase subunit A
MAEERLIGIALNIESLIGRGFDVLGRAPAQA